MLGIVPFATTLAAMTRIPQVRAILLLSAVTALLSQTVFEFGPLWLVELGAPAASYGPYWAALVATLGVGGWLAARLRLSRRRPVLGLALLLAAAPLVLALTGSLPVVMLAQAGLALLLAVLAVHAGLLLHDSVPSTIRAGVAGGVGTLSWVLFLPFSLGFGWLARAYGLDRAGWVLAGVGALLAVLLVASPRDAPRGASR